MPLLLEDLAGDAADSLRRAADRFEAAARELASAGSDGAEAARLARHLADYALAELPRAEALRKWEAEQPRTGRPDPEADRRLLALQTVFAGQARLCAIARGAWNLAAARGVAPERLGELDEAWRRLVQLARRAEADREYRAKGWQPKDPERFAEALRQIEAGEMKFVSAGEARQWFRPPEPAPEG